MPAVRPRPLYVALLLATIALGLASRRFSDDLPAVVARYAGDVLWASMMVWLVALARPRASSRWIGVVALLIAFAVEVSQLHQAPWINAIRATRPGALVLGQGFLFSDLVCYTFGVIGAAALDIVLRRRASREHSAD